MSSNRLQYSFLLLQQLICGAADVCILALSLALAPQMLHKGRFWQVPPDAYSRIEQGGIILKSSKNLETARAFRDFVLAIMDVKF